MTPMRMFTAVDAAIALATICGAAAAFAFLGSERPDRLVVFKQNSVIAEYPLGGDVAFTVNGKMGPLDIEIKNGIANIRHAGCPKGICTRSGGISNSNGRLICAPNNIMIQIQSANSGGVDGIAY
jgi:hypothetical protein